jgi:hypothetical protein
VAHNISECFSKGFRLSCQALHRLHLCASSNPGGHSLTWEKYEFQIHHSRGIGLPTRMGVHRIRESLWVQFEGNTVFLIISKYGSSQNSPLLWPSILCCEFRSTSLLCCCRRVRKQLDAKVSVLAEVGN